MDIFIAGGSGFIGNHLINELSSAGHNIVALIRPNSKLNQKLKFKPKLILKELNQLTVDDLYGIDVVVNLVCAGVSPKKATWEELENVNINFSMKLIKYAQLAKVKRFIATGSCLEYGTEANKWDFIHPRASLNPTTPYASSKAASFFLLNSFAEENSIEFFYGRIFYAFGSGQYRYNFFPSLKNAALNGEDFKISDPDVVLDFIPVEDVANHLRIAVERDDIISYKPFVVNIGTGKGVKLIDFAKSKWNEYMATGKLLTEENNNHGKNIKKFVANTVNLNYLNS